MDRHEAWFDITIPCFTSVGKLMKNIHGRGRHRGRVAVAANPRLWGELSELSPPGAVN